MAITNNKGDIGSPCLKPLLPFTKPYDLPFKAKEKLTVDIQVIIQLMN